jgi:hypothetical protein
MMFQRNTIIEVLLKKAVKTTATTTAIPPTPTPYTQDEIYVYGTFDDGVIDEDLWGASDYGSEFGGKARTLSRGDETQHQKGDLRRLHALREHCST